jgi:hypothetical protein
MNEVLQVTQQPADAGGNRLPTLAHEITIALAGHRASAIKSAEQAIEAGRLLVEAKELIPHGGWRTWLEDNCALSETSARRYMRLYRSGFKSATVADLGIRGADEALAKPKAELPATDATKCAEWWIRAASEKYPAAGEAFDNGFGVLPMPLEVLEVFEDAAADAMRPFASIRVSSDYPGYYEVFYLDGVREDVGGSEIVTPKLGWLDGRPKPILWEALPAWLVLASKGKLSPDRWRARLCKHWAFELLAEAWERSTTPLVDRMQLAEVDK